MGQWATVEDAYQYTGITVDSVNLTSAQAMVELFADAIWDETHADDYEGDRTLSSKNLRLLKMAVAYQAAWITDHPDVFTHMDIGTMLQDGIQYTNSHANSGILAPMAKRSIDRLSWRRNRSIRIRPRSMRLKDAQGRRIGFVTNATDYEDEVPWTRED